MLDPTKVERGMFRRDEIDYALIPAVNQSTLKYMLKSPLHFEHARATSKKPTAPMRLGTVAHTAVLEPARMAAEYIVYRAGVEVELVNEKTGIAYPATSKTATMNGKVWDAFEAQAAALNLTVIKEGELEAATLMQRAVRGNALARRYLASGTPEMILVWRDALTGLLCKARLDWVSTSVPDVMAELKTAADIAPWSFGKVYGKNGYHMQAAFYEDGYKAVTGRTLYSKCIAVENTEPHDVVVFDLAQVVDAGREDYRKLLNRVAECMAAGKWPGQAPDAEVPLELPMWMTEGDDDHTITGLGLEGFATDE